MEMKGNKSISGVLGLPFIALFQLLTFCISAQECPSLISPFNGETLVSTNTTITWEPVVGVPGYIISLGTTPGGGDIINELNVGSSNSFSPPTGLPENTEIFLTITLFFFNQPNIICESQRFTTASLTEAPACTLLLNPANNEIDVNTGTNISWAYAQGATGYLFSIGLTPNGEELLTTTDLGNTLNYNPIIDLPSETNIYVNITPYNRIGTSIGCTGFTFTTSPEAILPGCTSLITPFNGETNVPLSPILEWNEVPGATGYRVSIGTTPFETNILNNAAFFTNSTRVIDFEPNRTFFIKITPFNEAGEAIGCIQETFSTLLGCGPYFDDATGELVVLNPEITFPDTVSICSNREMNMVTATDQADSYRWFKREEDGNEVLISTEPTVEISQTGEYVYEISNEFEDSGNTFECSSSKIFRVTESSIASLEGVQITQEVTGINIEINIDGIGDYEFALDNENGPYQSSNLFRDLDVRDYILYVRDKNGCGVQSESIKIDIRAEGFPKFFTPNQDGFNDYWQYTPPLGDVDSKLSNILIYNRYGNLLAQISPNSLGWDGTYNGADLPASNYWYQAFFENEEIVSGYFMLKR